MADDNYNEDDIQLSENESDEDYETMVRTKGGDWTWQLQKSAQKGDLDHLKKCLLKGANKNVEDKKKWTPLIWAACKGHVEIVRYLIQQQAHEIYINNQNDANRHVIQGTINPNIKPTPLQWACFKGQSQIVNLLLKAELKWDDFDQFGNDCTHLAAASGNFQVFVILMALGVSVEQTNTRQHSCSDLSTCQKITNLINLHKQAKNCNICKNPLKTKHWCLYCSSFVCPDCKNQSWANENKDSIESEILDIRCKDCYQQQQKYESELQQVIDLYEYEKLKEKIDQIQEYNIIIDEKLKNQSLVVQQRLKDQLMITNQINNLKVVEDYKRILKYVKILTEMTEKAKENGVVLDQDVLELVENQKNRLIAERNLRYEIDNLETNSATQHQVDKLTDLMSIASNIGVADNYIAEAEVLRSKMFKGILSTNLYKLFQEYPTRWIPEPIHYDPKTKKPIDPVTKKPIDIKNLPKPPKPKKGDPKFVIPPWAETMDKHQEAITQFEEILLEQAELNLTPEFVHESKTQIARLKNDLRYRLILEKEAKELAEQKAADKAKNKKK